MMTKTNNTTEMKNGLVDNEGHERKIVQNAAIEKKQRKKLGKNWEHDSDDSGVENSSDDNGRLQSKRSHAKQSGPVTGVSDSGAYSADSSETEERTNLKDEPQNGKRTVNFKKYQSATNTYDSDQNKSSTTSGSESNLTEEQF
jgi:hypothetical protein